MPVARQLRLLFPGATYHVIARGNNREPIAGDDRDVGVFLDSLGSTCERHAWKVFAWCVMPNHYHLVLETMRTTLSKGMRQHNSVYAQYFNKRHARVGHVFQGRFKAFVVSKEEYLVTLLRYVELNPCRAGLVDDPAQWGWSSARASLGIAAARPWLAVQEVWDRFGASQREATANYREFLAAGLRESPPAFPVTGVVIGDEQCTASVLQGATICGQSTEIPKHERVSPPSLSEIFERTIDTDAAIREAYNAGYALKTIAQRVGAHYSTVSLIARRVEPRRRPSRIALRAAGGHTKQPE